MRTFFTTILILLSVSLYAANDSVPIAERINAHDRNYRNFNTLEKPSLKVMQNQYSLTNVSAGMNYRNESTAVVPQLGKGEISGNFDVNTFLTNKKGATWGNASYSNGKITDVQFNETNDFAMLYPYTLGDTVGGDLRFQNYRFGGGLSTNLGKTWELGIDAKYRADLAYRQIDPRPKNLVTDLNVAIGFSKMISEKYLLGIDICGEKYKQTNNMKFFSELGVPNVVHFTGLGTHYYRFQGSNYENYYKGYSTGGSIGLASKSDGWFGNLGYKYFTFQKIISTLNELPMARATEHCANAELAYLYDRSTLWSINAQTEFRHKTGIENIFDDATDNVYPMILSLAQFSSYDSNTELLALYGQNNEIHRWNVSMSLGYLSHSEKYKSPAQNLNLEHAVCKIGGQYTFRGQKIHISVSTNAAFYASTRHYLNLSGNTIWQIPVIQTYQVLSSNFVQSNTAFRFSYCFNPKIALFIDAKYSYTNFFSNTNQHITSISAGVNL